jgi:hypothetical protein
MASTKESFSKDAQCPVISGRVTLSGVIVSLGQYSEVTKRTCSDVAGCLSKYGPLEREPKCLLHTLSK